jgi:hypothetical protein
MKDYWGSGCIVPRILDLGTRWRWVVSLTPRPLYPQGKSHWYPLDRRLDLTQSRSGRGGEEKNSQPPPPPGNRTSDHLVRSPALYHWAIPVPIADITPHLTYNNILFQLIALGYGLDDRGSKVRFLAGAGNFSLHHCVQNGSGAHPASYPMVTRALFLGGKAAGAWSWPLICI